MVFSSLSNRTQKEWKSVFFPLRKSGTLALFSFIGRSQRLKAWTKVMRIFLVVWGSSLTIYWRVEIKLLFSLPTKTVQK